MTRVPVRREVLRWACERAGYDVRDLEPRFPHLPEWERGEKQPTFKQLEAFARATHTPFGFLFLPEPPAEALPIADLRTVKQRPARPSPDLLDTIFAMQHRQDWLREERIEGRGGPAGVRGQCTCERRAVGRRARDATSRRPGRRVGWGAELAGGGQVSCGAASQEAYDLTGLRGGAFQEYGKWLGMALP